MRILLKVVLSTINQTIKYVTFFKLVSFYLYLQGG